MALEGSIKEFGVADIIQLIAQQQKTGILLVEKKGQRAEVHFVEGQAINAHFFNRSTYSPLGEMLLRAQLIKNRDLKKALEKQETTYSHLGQILIKDGLIKKEALKKALQTQLYETFYDIIQWTEGIYKFISENIKADSKIINPTRIESIILDVLRMIDEWPEIEKIIPSFSMVFLKTDKSPEEFQDEEAKVYSLAKENNTVLDIIDRSLLGRFSTCKILADLLHNGYINPADSSTYKKRKKANNFTIQHKYISFVSYSVLALILVLIFFISYKHPGSFLNQGYLNKEDITCIKKSLRISRIQKIETALEIFRFKKGHYPDALQDLTKSSILADTDIPSFIVYHRQQRSYSLALN